jgi:CheY-like chemotaxis protein
MKTASRSNEEAPRKPAENADPSATAARPLTGRSPVVLVVDDYPPVVEMLAMALRTAGFVVWSAVGGEQAVRLFERHRDSIDLVLLDVAMSGMDGPQTLAALRRIDPVVRCVFMSGNTGRYSQAELLALGAVLVLGKPFASVFGLAETLRALVTPSPPEHRDRS